MYGGANRQLQPPDVDAFLAAFGPGDLLLLQNETSCVDYAIRMAREKGLRVAFNPSPIDEALLRAPLEAVDIFLLNEVGGRFRTGRGAGSSPPALS